MSRSTASLAAVFFILCLSLAYVAREQAVSSGSLDLGVDSNSAAVESAVVAEGDVPSVEAPIEGDVPAAGNVIDEHLELPVIEKPSLEPVSE